MDETRAGDARRSAASGKPRVLVVLADDGARALLAAALDEDGYDAVPGASLREALLRSARRPQPIVLAVVDDYALRRDDRLDRIPFPIVFVASALHDPPRSFARVLRRPVSLDEVRRAAESVAPCPSLAT